MPEWPRDKLEPPQNLFVTNIETWVECSGMLPDFTSESFPDARGFAVPIWVPSSMRVEAFYILNGASVAGSIQFALQPSVHISGRSHISMYSGFPNRCTAITEIVSQSGVNQWQRVDAVEPAYIQEGWHWIQVYHLSFGQYQRMYSLAGASSGETAMMGMITGYGPLPLTDLTRALFTRTCPILAIGGISV